MSIVRVGLPTALHPRTPEATLQRHVGRVARMFGWMYYHPPDNRPRQTATGRLFVQDVTPGWPDTVLIRGSRRLARELKSNRGAVTPEQRSWLDTLAAAGFDVGIWRPRDWPLIVAELAPDGEAA